MRQAFTKSAAEFELKIPAATLLASHSTDWRNCPGARVRRVDRVQIHRLVRAFGDVEDLAIAGIAGIIVGRDRVAGHERHRG